MKKLLHLTVLLISVASLAIGMSYVSAKVFRSYPQNNVASHQWIHQQLGLTASQHEALESLEERFELRKRELKLAVSMANKELAEAIQEDQTNSPRVSSAVEKIQAAQAQLQEATLGHVFEMEEVLTPGQYQKLLKLTATALNRTELDE